MHPLIFVFFKKRMEYGLIITWISISCMVKVPLLAILSFLVLKFPREVNGIIIFITLNNSLSLFLSLSLSFPLSLPLYLDSQFATLSSPPSFSPTFLYYMLMIIIKGMIQQVGKWQEGRKEHQSPHVPTVPSCPTTNNPSDPSIITLIMVVMKWT